mmetsp:Transcript_109282/g.315853  ORF Transcript_109282/g.315853 Transcript_109282/m.315853 type:complete len:383 (+) Transcript_109282:888-2036(+)
MRRGASPASPALASGRQRASRRPSRAPPSAACPWHRLACLTVRPGVDPALDEVRCDFCSGCGCPATVSCSAAFAGAFGDQCRAEIGRPLSMPCSRRRRLCDPPRRTPWSSRPSRRSNSSRGLRVSASAAAASCLPLSRACPCPRLCRCRPCQPRRRPPPSHLLHPRSSCCWSPSGSAQSFPFSSSFLACFSFFSPPCFCGYRCATCSCWLSRPSRNPRPPPRLRRPKLSSLRRCRTRCCRRDRARRRSPRPPSVSSSFPSSPSCPSYPFCSSSCPPCPCRPPRAFSSSASLWSSALLSRSHQTHLSRRRKRSPQRPLAVCPRTKRASCRPLSCACSPCRPPCRRSRRSHLGASLPMPPSSPQLCGRQEERRPRGRHQHSCRQ